MAKEDFEDIILVVGIRGSGMLKQLLIGHTAITVIDEINHTIVAVPDKSCAVANEFFNLRPRRIVVSLRYRFQPNEEALIKFLSTF